MGMNLFVTVFKLCEFFTGAVQFVFVELKRHSKSTKTTKLVLSGISDYCRFLPIFNLRQ